MRFSTFNRLLHLYLALALLPWFVMYGVSSVPFAHGAYFEGLDAKKGLPNWTLRYERALDVPPPGADDASLRREGRKEERKGEAKDELANAQERADAKADEVADLERKT